MPASLMMKPQNPPSAASSPAKGSLVTNFTVYLPAGSTLSTATKSDLPGDFSNSRSKVNFTSAEVISCPSWNLTPSRSLKVHVRASGLTCHDSASSGRGVMSGSKRTSWLYIIGERRLREKAGTSWGSSPVASVVCADTRLPPDLGVCAHAMRRMPSTEAVRAPACTNSRRFHRRAMGLSFAALVRARIEDVPKTVADQVERQDGDHDGDAREDGDPRGRLQIRAAF